MIPHLDPFDQLVQDLSKALGPSSGLNSSETNLSRLESLMSTYQSCPKGWAKYAFEDASRPYTRNLVDTANGKSNLLILVWTPGKSSPIHDHANAHCMMKILSGSLKEMLYHWPESDDSEGEELEREGEASPLEIKRETVFGRDQVTYMSDKLGLHKISNPNTNEFAVSLHLYTPPNAAKLGCHMYDEKTGQSKHIQQCHFYSELGRKVLL